MRKDQFEVLRYKNVFLRSSSYTLPGVVSVVLEAGVDDSIVGGDEAVLVAAVKVDTVRVEKQPVPSCGQHIKVTGPNKYYCFQTFTKLSGLANNIWLCVDIGEFAPNLLDE